MRYNSLMKPNTDQLDYLAGFVDALSGDPVTLNQLLSIAKLDSFQRQSLINTMLTEGRLKNIPKEMISAVDCLKDDDIAAKCVEILTKRQKKRSR
jgi:hypothetical protein